MVRNSSPADVTINQIVRFGFKIVGEENGRCFGGLLQSDIAPLPWTTWGCYCRFLSCSHETGIIIIIKLVLFFENINTIIACFRKAINDIWNEFDINFIILIIAHHVDKQILGY